MAFVYNDSPNPRRSSESHRYVALALEQRDAILYGLDDFYAKQCDWSPREGFNVAAFKENQQLANYFYERGSFMNLFVHQSLTNVFLLIFINNMLLWELFIVSLMHS